MRQRVSLISSLLVLVVLLAGCRSESSGASRPATATKSSPASGQATATREVENMRSVRPIIQDLVAALKRNDVAAAKTAYTRYDSAWNGIEGHLNFRLPQLYDEIEHGIQEKIGDGLDDLKPSTVALVPLAESMLQKYDQAIKLSETGKPISGLFRRCRLHSDGARQPSRGASRRSKRRRPSAILIHGVPKGLARRGGSD